MLILQSNEMCEEQEMGLRDSLQGLKIALVEDDPWVQNSLRLYFQYNGCHLEVFGNATLALDAMENEKFDIIISAYWLPDMDGLTMISRVKKHQPDAFLLLITAYPTTGLQETAARMGVHEFLPKPLTVSQLDRALETLNLGDSDAAAGG